MVQKETYIPLTIYTAYIGPILDYGCVMHAPAKKSLLLHINFTENKDLRLISGLLRTTKPTRITELPPFVYRSQLIINYIWSSARNSNHPNFQRFLSQISNTLKSPESL